MTKFVSEKEAEDLAEKHIAAFIDECRCQTVDDVKLASQKLLAVTTNVFELLHSEDLKVSRIQ